MESVKQKITLRQWGILISSCLMFFLAPTHNDVATTFSLMPDHFGVTPAVVGYISGIANPSACIAGLFVGAFAGRRISYKMTGIISMTLFVVFGSIPFFWRDLSFAMLLFSRFLFGLGCGCINPFVQAVITHMFKSETARSVWIGIINVIFNVGSSCGNLITGTLALSGWQNAYALYLLGAVPLIFIILFFKDSEITSDSKPADDATEKPVEKRRISGSALLYIFVYMFCTIISQVFFIYAGIAMGMSGLNTVFIGMVFSVFAVSGILIAAANALMWKFLRLYNFPLSYLLLSVSYVFCIIGFNTGGITWFYLAAIVMGTGCCLCGMTIPMILSVSVPAASLTLAIGFQEVARNLGSFLSSPWLQIIGAVFGDEPVQQFTATAILGAVITIMALFLAIRDNKKYKNVSTRR